MKSWWTIAFSPYAADHPNCTFCNFPRTLTQKVMAWAKIHKKVKKSPKMTENGKIAENRVYNEVFFDFPNLAHFQHFSHLLPRGNFQNSRFGSQKELKFRFLKSRPEGRDFDLFLTFFVIFWPFYKKSFYKTFIIDN